MAEKERLSLPDLTVVVPHGRVALELFKLSLRDTLKQIKPGAVIIFSNEPEAWASEEVDVPKEIIEIPVCNSSADIGLVSWYTMTAHIKTNYMLHIDWDGWVIDASRWEPEFMAHDFIGSPWFWIPDENKRVGGNLQIRSTDLMRFLMNHKEDFPFSHPEDVAICQNYRPRLEKCGFTFAPYNVAERFSLERGDYRETFAFHGVFNWMKVLGYEGALERMKYADDYVRRKSEWRELLTQLAIL